MTHRIIDHYSYYIFILFLIILPRYYCLLLTLSFKKAFLCRRKIEVYSGFVSRKYCIFLDFLSTLMWIVLKCDRSQSILIYTLMQLDVTSRFFFFLALPFIQTKSKYANISFDIKDIKEDKIHPHPSLSPLFKLESIYLF